MLDGYAEDARQIITESFKRSSFATWYQVRNGSFLYDAHEIVVNTNIALRSLVGAFGIQDPDRGHRAAVCAIAAASAVIP